MTVTASPEAVRAALGEVESRLLKQGAGDPLTAAAQIVLAEVLNNIVEHALGERGKGAFSMDLRLTGRGLACVIRDQGCPMPERILPGADLPDVDVTEVEGLPEGGFGWAIVHDMTCDLQYRRARRENILSFTILRPPSA